MGFSQVERGEPKYINYRDLSVQQLGSIYERLLEYDVVSVETGGIDIRLNSTARKGSGSYYTPDSLVRLIIDRAVGPQLDEAEAAFRGRLDELVAEKRPADQIVARLQADDPATAMLRLKICDPAMGSGHFLVSLVDVLAERILLVLDQSVGWVREKLADAALYQSPVLDQVQRIRDGIVGRAAERKWAVDLDLLEDRQIVRRMVLKRCVYGVDKNPMAVELAKVALWLHTFTIGAPLSFLDHHLRCGDSLFGAWPRTLLDRVGERGLFGHDALARAQSASRAMEEIEGLSDADIAEVEQSKNVFADIQSRTRSLDQALGTLHALVWLDPEGQLKAIPKPKRGENPTPAYQRAQAAVQGLNALFDGTFGDPIALLAGDAEIPPPTPEQQPDFFQADMPPEPQGLFAHKQPQLQVDQVTAVLAQARALAAEERFLSWPVAFPGVWRNWSSVRPDGGFDAIIGNPPWDRIKLQEVEWFAARRPEIALQERASDRKHMVAALEASNDPLFIDYQRAAWKADRAGEVARSTWISFDAKRDIADDNPLREYPLLSGGDINLYSLFVERAFRLVQPIGIVGLLTPSGIASDKGASAFFRSIATTGRLAALFDFENRRGTLPPFFPDVDSRFKFCALIAGSTGRTFPAARCAFFLQDPAAIADPEIAFTLSAADFAAVNPNTGTAPIFRRRKDADLTLSIYRRTPVLVDHQGAQPVRTWPVRYMTMFHMTNDSHLFRTKSELESSGAYSIGPSTYKKGHQKWVPLYVGRMINQFDHRASSVSVNVDNLYNPSVSDRTAKKDIVDPAFTPASQYWVGEEEVTLHSDINNVIGFRDIARSTDIRTAIFCIMPKAGYGNTLPIIIPKLPEEPPTGDIENYKLWERNCSDLIKKYKWSTPLLTANANSFGLDYINRQKVQSTHLNWYIVEQLPFLPPTSYQATVGTRPVTDLIRHEVLKLTYVSHDMAPFARDQGYDGAPFPWDEEERRHSRARLDALYFLLYGITDEADISYILDTFPIVKQQDMEQSGGRFVTSDLILNYLRAFKAGDTDTRIRLRQGP